MDKRQFEILVVGRCNGDLIVDVDKYPMTVSDNNLIITDTEKKHIIRTDTKLSETNDKVTSLEDLDNIVDNIEYYFRWGGGAVNSVLTLADLRINSPELGISFITPAKTYLAVGSKLRDLNDYLDKKNVNNLFMNFTHQNYNLVFGGRNKSIIRNKPRAKETFKMSREQKMTLNNYINPASGILINALNDSDMTAHIVQTVYAQNERLYNGVEADSKEDMQHLTHDPSYMTRPMHRIVMTVITKSGSMSKDHIIENIVPYTGIITNKEEFLKIFYDKTAFSDKDAEEKAILESVAHIRYGIPRQMGLPRKIEDNYNNMYVTDGKRGHYVNIQDKVYKVRMKEEKNKHINELIHQNKSSTAGGGDSFSAGIIHQETIRAANDVVGTAAFANTSFLKYIGIHEYIFPDDIELEKEYDLKKYV